MAIARFAGLDRIAVHDKPIEQRLAFNGVAPLPLQPRGGGHGGRRFGLPIELLADPDAGLSQEGDTLAG